MFGIAPPQGGVRYARMDKKDGMRRKYIVSWVWCIMCALLVVGGCSKKKEPPSKWEQTQESVIGEKAASKEAIKGGEFNKFLPKTSEGFTLVYTQEKDGFAQAKLKKDGAEMATLSVTDTTNNPEAAVKYQKSNEQLSTYPLVAIGSQGTGVLIAGRFQVQIRSMADEFTENDRKAWLKKFDLNGLAGLSK